MEIYWYLDEHALSDSIKVNLKDITIYFETRSVGIIKSMNYFIDNTIHKNRKEYILLKELIYSEDKDNIIMAWTIIDKI